MEDFGLSAHVRSSHGRAGGEPPSVCRQAGKVIRIRMQFPSRRLPNLGGGCFLNVVLLCI